jgi:hypothetical protein
MKRALFILIMCSAICLFGGCTNGKMDYNHPDVALFVKQLKAGTYRTKSPQGFIEVPKFTEANIPELLKYSSDLTVIPSFPMPPTTSTAYETKIRLGECILWIVESIRLGHSASQGCHLVVANAENYEAIYFLTDKELLDASNRYRSWWKERSEHHSRTMWTIEPCYDIPLCSSGYRWW